jgi:hypothetical protein
VTDVQESSAKEQHDDITLIVAKCRVDERQIGDNDGIESVLGYRRDG